MLKHPIDFHHLGMKHSAERSEIDLSHYITSLLFMVKNDLYLKGPEEFNHSIHHIPEFSRWTIKTLNSRQKQAAVQKSELEASFFFIQRIQILATDNSNMKQINLSSS